MFKFNINSFCSSDIMVKNIRRNFGNKLETSSLFQFISVNRQKHHKLYNIPVQLCFIAIWNMKGTRIDERHLQFRPAIYNVFIKYLP